MSSKKRVIPATRPRNPLVALAQRRHAGSHRPSNKVLRAQAKRRTERALQTDDSVTWRSRGRAGGWVGAV